MTTLSQQPTHSTKRPFLNRKTVIIGAGSLIGLTAVLALSFLLSPIGQRWLAQPASAPAVETNYVIMQSDPTQNHLFSPPVIQIERGTTVTWAFAEVDEDGQPVEHNVVFETANSPIQATGTYELTFNEPGVYGYVCTLHPFMEGTVIVTD